MLGARQVGKSTLLAHTFPGVRSVGRPWPVLPDRVAEPERPPFRGREPGGTRCDTYLERDVRLLGDVRDISEFRRFLSLSAALSGQEVNVQQLGRELGASATTARRWRELLVQSFQWLDLSPLHGNALKRVSGKRKGFMRDTGTVSFLQRIATPDSLVGSHLLGALFETWGVNQVHRLSSTMPVPPLMHHWRMHGGAEVDLVLERDGALYPIEFKCKAVLSGHDTRGMTALRAQIPKARIQPGLVVYAGAEAYRLNVNTTAVPWNLLR